MKYLIYLLTLFLSSCSVSKNYTRPTDIVIENIYGEISLGSDSTNIGQQSWRTIFTDSLLQQLIERALVGNTDLRIAHQRVEQAEATLSATRLSFLPSLALSAQGGVGSFGGNATGGNYAVTASSSWQIDIFGKLHNAQKRSKADVESSYAYKQAVQTELIATVATKYYTLSMLREQLEIAQTATENWSKMVRTMRILMESGQYNDAAVSQAEANYNRIEASTLEIRQQVLEMENSISILLGEAIRGVKTNGIGLWQADRNLNVGIPLQLLSQRPDVRQAEHNLAKAFFMTNESRAAFYPSLTLGGGIGWTNVAGVVANPAKLLIETLNSLTQPLFQNGRLNAQLRIAKAQQEQAKLQYGQILMDAGLEVNNAYTQVISYKERAKYYQNQVLALEHTFRATQLLMEGGSSSYLEVLTAQDNILDAKLSLVINQYNEIASFISLYQALGGGVN